MTRARAISRHFFEREAVEVAADCVGLRLRVSDRDLPWRFFPASHPGVSLVQENLEILGRIHREIP